VTSQTPSHCRSPDAEPGGKTIGRHNIISASAHVLSTGAGRDPGCLTIEIAHFEPLPGQKVFKNLLKYSLKDDASLVCRRPFAETCRIALSVDQENEGHQTVIAHFIDIT
jgi:hypothetical protein